VVLHNEPDGPGQPGVVNNLADPGHFVRAVHVTGDLENLGQGTAEGQALLRHRG